MANLYLNGLLTGEVVLKNGFSKKNRQNTTFISEIGFNRNNLTKFILTLNRLRILISLNQTKFLSIMDKIQKFSRSIIGVTVQGVCRSIEILLRWRFSWGFRIDLPIGQNWKFGVIFHVFFLSGIWSVNKRDLAKLLYNPKYFLFTCAKRYFLTWATNISWIRLEWPFRIT